MKGVSIVVCCYNSAARLPQTLRYLSRQIFQREFPWEVIVVDNASTDGTASVAKLEWARYNTNGSLKVVTENIKGLSAARERGVRESTFRNGCFL